MISISITIKITFVSFAFFVGTFYIPSLFSESRFDPIKYSYMKLENVCILAQFKIK